MQRTLVPECWCEVVSEAPEAEAADATDTSPDASPESPLLDAVPTAAAGGEEARVGWTDRPLVFFFATICIIIHHSSFTIHLSLPTYLCYLILLVLFPPEGPGGSLVNECVFRS